MTFIRVITSSSPMVALCPRKNACSQPTRARVLSLSRPLTSFSSSPSPSSSSSSSSSCVLRPKKNTDPDPNMKDLKCLQSPGVSAFATPAVP